MNSDAAGDYVGNQKFRKNKLKKVSSHMNAKDRRFYQISAIKNIYVCGIGSQLKKCLLNERLCRLSLTALTCGATNNCITFAPISTNTVNNLK